MLKLGYAEVDITPEKPMPLIGFDREDDMSRGVLKPLLAQVSVWENEERCCLVCIDSIGFAKRLADDLRDRIGQRLNIGKDKVMLCFSHCHSAPDADSMPDYYESVCMKTVSAAARAVSAMQPVSCGWANAEAEIAVNRRGGESVDKRVGILKACDNAGNNKLLLLRLTAHCNVLKGDNYYVSPDYFGSVRDLFGREYGCPVMLIQGSAGNMAPKYFKSSENPIDAQGPEYIRSDTALEDMAKRVYESASLLIDGIELRENLPVKMYSSEMKLYSDVPEYDRAKEIADEAKLHCGIDGASWLKEVSRLHDAGITRQEEHVEVQYFSIGQLCLCGVPYELMVEFALETMKELDDEFFYFNGYTNGCLSYFPTEAEFDKGGYEVYWSLLIYFPYFDRIFPFEKSSASKLMDFVVRRKLK